MHGRGALEAGAQRKGHSVAGWELPDEQVCVEGHFLGKQTSMRKVKSRRESCARKTQVVLLEGSAHWGRGGLEDKKQERGTRHVSLRSLQGPPLFNMHQPREHRLLGQSKRARACVCVQTLTYVLWESRTVVLTLRSARLQYLPSFLITKTQRDQPSALSRSLVSIRFPHCMALPSVP